MTRVRWTHVRDADTEGNLIFGAVRDLPAASGVGPGRHDAAPSDRELDPGHGARLHPGGALAESAPAEPAVFPPEAAATACPSWIS
jgi:hypothetical protein